MATAEASGEEEKEFDLRIVGERFQKSLLSEDAEDILLVEYIAAYNELNKIFPMLGRLFSFVHSDVSDKLKILGDYVEKEHEERESYQTLKKMIAHELRKKTTDSLKPPSAARTLLRLHRALQFINRLLRDMHDAPETEKMPALAGKAYDETLARFHPWLIRKGVHLALYVLPNREQLIKQLSGHLGEVDADAAMMEMVKHGEEIYALTETVYKDNALLQLP